jgi:hypothetical protein
LFVFDLRVLKQRSPQVRGIRAQAATEDGNMTGLAVALASRRRRFRRHFIASLAQVAVQMFLMLITPPAIRATEAFVKRLIVHVVP